jgi:hypothetical protein
MRSLVQSGIHRLRHNHNCLNTFIPIQSDFLALSSPVTHKYQVLLLHVFLYIDL